MLLGKVDEPRIDFYDHTFGCDQFARNTTCPQQDVPTSQLASVINVPVRHRRGR